MIYVSDDDILDVEGRVRHVLRIGAEAGRLQLRPSTCHIGVMYGELREQGVPHDVATDHAVRVAHAWTSGDDSDRVPGVVPIPDDEVLALIDQLGRIPADDWGSVFDLGVKYGGMRQSGYSVALARTRLGDWVVRYFGGEHPWPSVVPVLTALHVEGNRRYFANAEGRFDWREVTAFSLLSRMLKGQDESHVRPLLKLHRAAGFTVTRVILTLDGDYWRDYRCAPDMATYWQSLDALVRMHAEEGLYMRACFLGALEPFGGVWNQARSDIYTGPVRTKAEQFVVEAALRIGREPHVIGELANEPTQIGMRDSWPALVTLGAMVKKVAPNMLLCGGEDNDGRGVVRPFDFADAHIDRAHEVQGWQWVKRMGEHPVIDQAVMPFVAGENRNMGEARADGNTGDGPETQPAVCFGVAAVSRARRMGGVCFHYDGGLWTTVPKPETVACIAAWHAGFDAFPMLTDAMWRGHWGLSRGDYWKDVWPNTDDPATVEAHVRAGRGPWRAFGCGAYAVCFPEPNGWNWQANLDAPADRVAESSHGTFPCGVYRRR